MKCHLPVAVIVVGGLSTELPLKVTVQMTSPAWPLALSITSSSLLSLGLWIIWFKVGAYKLGDGDKILTYIASPSSFQL